MDLSLQYTLNNWSAFSRSLNVGWGGSYIVREIVLPIGARVGLSYSQDILSLMELSPFAGLHYQNDAEMFFPLGLEVNVSDVLEWRVSWASSEGNSRIGTGVGLNLNWIELNYGFQSHSYLGGYHSLNLIWPF